MCVTYNISTIRHYRNYDLENETLLGCCRCLFPAATAHRTTNTVSSLVWIPVGIFCVVTNIHLLFSGNGLTLNVLL